MKKLLVTTAGALTAASLMVGVAAASSTNISNTTAICENNVWVSTSTTQNSSSGNANSSGGNATSGSATNSSGQTVTLHTSCGKTASATPAGSTTPSGGKGGVSPSSTPQVSTPSGAVRAGGGAGSRLTSAWSIAGLGVSSFAVVLGLVARKFALAK